jgi:hypothetical protein
VHELEKRAARIWKANEILSALKVEEGSLLAEDEVLKSATRLIDEANRAKAAARLALRAEGLIKNQRASLEVKYSHC